MCVCSHKFSRQIGTQLSPLPVSGVDVKACWENGGATRQWLSGCYSKASAGALTINTDLPLGNHRVFMQTGKCEIINRSCIDGARCIIYFKKAVSGQSSININSTIYFVPRNIKHILKHNTMFLSFKRNII